MCRDPMIVAADVIAFCFNRFDFAAEEADEVNVTVWIVVFLCNQIFRCVSLGNHHFRDILKSHAGFGQT